MDSLIGNRTTNDKALQINLDLSIYGAFAEIGAGQEVARFFFQAGKASQTIAKTMSAYDMIVSDDIYGKEASGRYVCESRVVKMIDHEYALLLERLSEKRADSTRFFAFADTVATAAPDSGKQSHGWFGLRFQTRPGGAFNDIVLHVRMRDKYRLQQQEALGVLGVNLIHTAFNHLDRPKDLVSYLTENLREDQIVIDVIKFKGPDVSHIDARLVNLELVRRGLAECILFSPEMEILNIADEVYKKNILIQRGKFSPVTITHEDVMSKGMTQLRAEIQKSTDGDEKLPIMHMMELTMQNRRDENSLDEKDYLTRIEMLCKLGHHVLISNFFLYYGLKRFLRRYNNNQIALVVGASQLNKLFNEEHYRDLEGGLLEGLGKLLDNKTNVYVYPHKTADLCLTAKSFNPTPHLKNVYSYFIDNKKIADISGCDEASSYHHSADVVKLIESGNPEWEKLVPSGAIKLVKEKYGIK